MTTPWRRARRRLLEAPHLPIALYLGVFGLSALAGDRSPALESLPVWLVGTWAVSLVVGAGLVTWGVMGQRTRAESSGHMLHLCGLAFYGAAHLSLIGGDDVVTLAVLAGVAAIRMRVLVKSREAMREAGRILGGER